LGLRGVMAMVINTTFNNISAITWRSVLLVEETRVPGENHQPAKSHWQTWSDITRSFTHSWLITGFVNRITQHDGCHLWGRNCLPFRSNYIHSWLLVGSCCSIFSFLCSVLKIIVCPFSLGHCIICLVLLGLISQPTSNYIKTVYKSYYLPNESPNVVFCMSLKPFNVMSGTMMTVFVRLLHSYFIYLIILHLGNKILNGNCGCS
jgi:hypothetical protein